MPVLNKAPFHNHLGVKNHLDDFGGFAPQGLPLRWQSHPDQPATFLAYITDKEAEKLRELNLHDKPNPEDIGTKNRGPGGIPSYDDSADGVSGADSDSGGGDDSYGYDDVNMDPNPEPGSNPGGAPGSPGGPPGPDSDSGGFFGSMLSHALENPISTLANIAINSTPLGLIGNLATMGFTGRSIAGNIANALGSPVSPSPTASAVGSMFGNSATTPGSSTAPSVAGPAPSLGPDLGPGGTDQVAGPTLSLQSTPALSLQPAATTSLDTAPVTTNPYSLAYQYNPLPSGHGTYGQQGGVLGHRYFT